MEVEELLGVRTKIARRGEDWEWSVDESSLFTAGWAGSFADCWGERSARGTAVEVSEDMMARNAPRTVFHLRVEERKYQAVSQRIDPLKRVSRHFVSSSIHMTFGG